MHSSGDTTIPDADIEMDGVNSTFGNGYDHDELDGMNSEPSGYDGTSDHNGKLAPNNIRAQDLS